MLVVLVEGTGGRRRHENRQRQHDELAEAQAGARTDGETGQRCKGDDYANAQLEQAEDGAQRNTGGGGWWRRRLHRRF